MLNKKNVLLIIILVLTLTAPILSAEIYLYDEVEINSSKIILGEIAEIDTDSNEIYEELSAIELGDAPRPGRSLEMNPELVSLYIRNNGFSRDDYEIISNGNIKIKVRSKELSGEDLFSKVEKIIREKINDNVDLEALNKDFLIDIKLISGPDNITTPAGDLKILIAEDIKRPAGRLNLPVEIYVDDNYWKRVYMTLGINYQMEVYLLENNISRNEKIEKDDLISKDTMFDFYPNELVLNLENEIFRHGVTRRNYQKGDILKLSMLEYPDIISFNQEITAEFEHGSVFVKTKVKARGKGSIGEIIEVENIDTGQIIKAEILNENRVRIIN